MTRELIGKNIPRHNFQIVHIYLITLLQKYQSYATHLQFINAFIPSFVTFVK